MRRLSMLHTTLNHVHFSSESQMINVTESNLNENFKILKSLNAGLLKIKIFSKQDILVVAVEPF